MKIIVFTFGDNNNNNNNSNNNNDNNNNNKCISAYPFYMKLALCPKIICTKKKYYTIRYRKIII